MKEGSGSESTLRYNQTKGFARTKNSEMDLEHKRIARIIEGLY